MCIIIENSMILYVSNPDIDMKQLCIHTTARYYCIEYSHLLKYRLKEYISNCRHVDI